MRLQFVGGAGIGGGVLKSKYRYRNLNLYFYLSASILMHESLNSRVSLFVFYLFFDKVRNESMHDIMSRKKDSDMRPRSKAR